MNAASLNRFERVNMRCCDLQCVDWPVLENEVVFAQSVKGNIMLGWQVGMCLKSIFEISCLEVVEMYICADSFHFSGIGSLVKWKEKEFRI